MEFRREIFLVVNRYNSSINNVYFIFASFFCFFEKKQISISYIYKMLKLLVALLRRQFTNQKDLEIRKW